MSNFAPDFKDNCKHMLQNNENRTILPEIGLVQTADDGILFLNNLREVKNLSTMRLGYNTIVYCRSGRILIELGGNQQVRVKPGEMLLIPTGKLVQPMMVSTDVDANALLISDTVLKSVLGSQISIWNRAMYMKEIYVLEDTSWAMDMGRYTASIFQNISEPVLYSEIIHSFLRTMLLFVCEDLLRKEAMSEKDDASSTHEKEIFNNFLQLISHEQQKRQQVSVYAGKLNITPKYLSAVCKKVSGKTPMRWITESVMEDCYNQLLKTDLSVKEIAHLLGFPNSSFFGQYFRDQAGVTPMEYRTQHKKIV